MAAVLLVWQTAASVMDSPLILPPPKSVIFCMGRLLADSSFWTNALTTFARVAKAFSISLIFGSMLGIACGKSRFLKDFFALPISILRSTPVVALILILIFSFSSGNVPVAVAVLMSLPVMVSALSSGFSLSEDDKKMMQMARVFSLKTAQRIRFIWIPKLKPFFKSGTVSVFGMTWKVVVAGEVLSLPNKAIGTQLSAAQVHLETQEVMALSIVIVALSFAMETLLKLILERNK